MGGMWSNLNDIIKAKTMTPDCLVNKIVDEFRSMEEEIQQRDSGDRPQSDEPWTREILTTLCNLGKCLNYEAWAAGTYRNPVPNEYRERGEFLYDVSWRKLDNCGRIISFPMVAESEWGGLKKIEYDFQKLLIARAQVRVMVYDGGAASKRNKKNQPILNRLREQVGAFNGTQGDTYLLIPYLHVKGEERGFKFKFHQITYKGPGNEPEIKEL